MAIHLGRALPRASCNQPGRRSGNGPEDPRLQRRPSPSEKTCAFVPPLFGLAPGGVCRAAPVARTRGALLPHPFTLTREAAGGLLSVALSLGSPPPDVIRHRASMEPGLSSARPHRAKSPHMSGRAAAIRPADITDRWGFRAQVKGGKGPRMIARPLLIATYWLLPPVFSSLAGAFASGLV